MKKNNNKFLNTNIEKKTFDAFNVTSMLLFFGVLATFIVSLVDYSMIVSAAQDKAHGCQTDRLSGRLCGL